MKRSAQKRERPRSNTSNTSNTSCQEHRSDAFLQFPEPGHEFSDVVNIPKTAEGTKSTKLPKTHIIAILKGLWYYVQPSTILRMYINYILYGGRGHEEKLSNIDDVSISFLEKYQEQHKSPQRKMIVTFVIVGICIVKTDISLPLRIELLESQIYSFCNCNNMNDVPQQTMDNVVFLASLAAECGSDHLTSLVNLTPFTHVRVQCCLSCIASSYGTGRKEYTSLLVRSMPSPNILDIHKWMIMGCSRTNRINDIKHIMKDPPFLTGSDFDYPAVCALISHNFNLYVAFIGMGARNFQSHHQVAKYLLSFSKNTSKDESKTAVSFIEGLCRTVIALETLHKQTFHTIIEIIQQTNTLLPTSTEFPNNIKSMDSLETININFLQTLFDETFKPYTIALGLSQN